jgi:predicted site-specific integrase-resolvase
MLLGYARISTNEQRLDLQRDALRNAGVSAKHLYTDTIMGIKAERPGLDPSLSTVAMAKKLYADQMTAISDMCKTLHISRATLYRYIHTGGGHLAKP